MTNLYLGLARGPIDHEASSVINMIADGALDMGAVIKTIAAPTTELLPRAVVTDAQGELCYGIAVGGDVDGIYGDGGDSVDDSTRATSAAGQGVVVVTQGRCLAKCDGTTTIGMKLTPSAAGGVEPALTGDVIIAKALQVGADGDVIAVDVQREGDVA